MSNPRNDDYGNAGYGDPRNDPRAVDPRNDPRAADPRGYSDPAYDDRPVQRDTYVERDRIVAPAQERLATEPQPNPLAGIMLIIGGLMGVLAGLIPDGGDTLPIAGTIDLFGTGDVNAIVLAAAIIVVFLCGLGALAVGAQMFAPKWHASASRTGMTLGILMLIASLAVIIIAGSDVFDGATLSRWLLLLACVPTIIGALIGFSRK